MRSRGPARATSEPRGSVPRSGSGRAAPAQGARRRRHRSRPRAACLALVAACCVALAAAAAPAGAVDQRSQDALDRAVAYLQRTQNLDGGFGHFDGDASDEGTFSGFSSWACMAIAGAGINPRDQRRPDGGTDLLGYVRAAVPKLTLTNDVSRVAMCAIAAGVSPRDFGGRDLLAETWARQLDDGSLPQSPGGPPLVNHTIFALFPAHEDTTGTLTASANRALDWVISQQHDDGSWSSYRPGDPTPNSDMTGAAIQALCLWGRCAGPAAVKALTWLEANQQDDGGWSQGRKGSGVSTAGSTAWATQALWAAGLDPESERWTTPSGHTPLGFLADLQNADGGISNDPTNRRSDIWMTAQVMLALSGHPFPPPAAPRAAPQPEHEQPAGDAGATPAPTTDLSQAGQGGADPDGDGAVTAGGGGRGAPLFSRPKAQSRGRTPGGIRRLRGDQARQASTRGDRRGATRSAASTGSARRGVGGGAPLRREHVPVGTHAETSAGATDGIGPAAATRGAGDGRRAVEGTVVSTATPGRGGRDREDAVAPGLRAARLGGDSDLALALAGALVLAALAGTQLERRQRERVA